MTKINIAVIGVGRWGVHLLRNFLEHPQVHVAAVVDPNPERLASVQRLYQLEENVVLTTEWPSIKEISGLTAVAIATPATTHYGLIKDALEWGFHVLAEKPLTLDPAECQELCELAQQQQLILMVDHTYLFHPAVERGQAVVQGGQLGDLRYGYATRTHLGPVRQDVDALWDLAIHDIAIFNNWLGQVPVKAQATGKVWLQGDGTSTTLSPREMGLRLPSAQGRWDFDYAQSKGVEGVVKNDYSSSPSKNSGLADLVWVTLTYPDGFQAYIHLCWLNTDKQRRLAVVGSQGSLIFDEMLPSSPLTLLSGEFEQQGQQFLPVNQRQEVLEITKSEPLQQVCDRFVTCVLNRTPPVVSSGLVGTQLVQVLTALTVSLHQGGQPVDI